LKPETLQAWLDHIERVHPKSIEMGLERMLRVRQALVLDPAFAVISVGGTNGKGSACAMLEAILHRAGYNVGCYTSPHLLRYNERVRIGCREAEDDVLCHAFSAVEAARVEKAAATPLTYFEFGTLAAMRVFTDARIDVAILEIGLGGRLDAVNAFDADCAMVMSVDIDHVEYLGDTRELIGLEKAGIFRAHRPAVCADPQPPQSLEQFATDIGAQLLTMGKNFGYVADRTQWQYWGPAGKKSGLPWPALRGSYQIANAAACLAALDTLRDRFPVSMEDIRAGLLHVECPGRFQVLPGRPAVILDVAHNPQAARVLADNLAAMRSFERTFAVFAMLRDKDIQGVIDAIRDKVDHWLIAAIEGPRGADAVLLQSRLMAAGVTAPVTACATIAAAYVRACDMATKNDRIVVFGSFYTVAAVVQCRATQGIRRAAGKT